MNVISYTALHYGKDYLYYAIKSVIDHVDKHYILYTPIGSHGHRTPVPCPETRDELFAIAQAAAGDKLVWVDGEWPYEGAQREHIHVVAPDADVVLVVDADEVWSERLVRYATRMHPSRFYEKNIERFRVPIIHYWRSFYRCILHDPAFPTRIIYPKIRGAEDTLTSITFLGARDWTPPGIAAEIHEETVTMPPINHFGYAQRPEIVEYKQLTHGHRGEWRRDVDWFNDVFMANRQQDCHPVGSDHWQPESVNPLDYMPEFMSQHPYFNREVIE